MRENLWKLDCIGINDIDESPSDEFREQLEFDEGRYCTGLSWKRDPIEAGLPDNKENSRRQLISKVRSLKRNNPEVLTEYHRIMQSQLQDGIIEKCGEDVPHGATVHYLPHRPVIRTEKETTKIRIVYNASSKLSKEQPSLNDCLLKGPSMNPLIIEILLRFRIHPTAFVCDIEKAFLQICIKQSERDFLRFFWVDDPFKENPTIISYRFCRVLFGLTCSPFLLNATLREHFRKYLRADDPLYEMIVSILVSLFVDDNVGGGDNTTNAFTKFRKLVEILQDASFHVHKFVSNDTELTSMVTSLGGNYVKTSKSTGVHEVLGVLWDYGADNLLVNLGGVVERVERPTKRNALRTIAKIYDPLGMISPVVLRGKLMFQEMCRRNIGWDEQLPDDIARQWSSWIDEILTARLFQLPRCYEKDEVKKSVLVGFSDGSTKAYAAAVYLRSELSSGAVSSILVCSKARVTPLEKDVSKKCTIPRVELLGCVMLAHLMKTVEKSFTEAKMFISEKMYFTDSTISLFRIQGVGTEYQQWVQNRVKTIRTLSSPNEWHYVPTKMNPSDIPSRGCALGELQESDMWRLGPSFIREVDIPNFTPKKPEPETEMKSNCLVSVSSEPDDAPPMKNLGRLPADFFRSLENRPRLEDVIDVTKFSDLGKLLRVTSYVLRIIQRQPGESDEVSVEELESARVRWILNEQRKYAQLEKEKFMKTANNLCFFQDDGGIIRCRGRLKHTDLPYTTKFPIFIPTESGFSKLLVTEAHDQVFHQKVAPTLVQLRSEYWIPRSRQLVAKIVSKCSLCLVYDAAPYKPTPLPVLPKFRVEVVPPFQNVGTDHVGPLFVRDIYLSGSMYKCYIAIFSCCVTRMVHLQLQPDLEAPSTIRGMKRTFARVGTPALLLSDNHKTYRSQAVRTFAKSRGITWRPILELSPNWGGFYERMNSMIKGALRKTLKSAQLTFEELETVIIEIDESVINSRPLTYVHDDELLEPLTPSHLMYGRRLNSRLPTDAPGVDIVVPSRRVQYVNRLLENYWRRFSTEYLTSLRERASKGGTVPLIEPGHIVLVKEKRLPRSQWHLGKVERVIRAPDGVPKGAELRTKGVTIKRPLSLLCPVELHQPPTPPTSVQPPTTSTPVQTPTPVAPSSSQDVSIRVRRGAAVIGENRRRGMLP